ncbi:uncharacterized protein LOC126672352 [Mercurialis annua]|uniref:uncharacterized protein LOC126672352 n=1 Tax=Mercurialis annua TaxID=3986 RepID=UPI00215E20E3|nr:uncharacterized protein LOC126672352 [Mercurialis annua]
MEGGTSETTSKGRKDPAWNYSRMAYPPRTNDLVCNFCSRIIKGGVYRMKYHFIGGDTMVTPCLKCPPPVRQEIQEYMGRKAASSVSANIVPDLEDLGYGNDEQNLDEVDASKGSKGASNKSAALGKTPKQKGPLNVYFALTPDQISKKAKTSKQTTINNACKK